MQLCTMPRMEKTDKTLAEMQVDLNLNYDWSRICESGDKPLVRLRGPGLVGLKNLGSAAFKALKASCFQAVLLHELVTAAAVGATGSEAALHGCRLQGGESWPC